MICPRCGTSNAADRPTCSRCAGALVPPPAGTENALPPQVPITRRAELTMGRTGRGAQAPPGAADAALRAGTPSVADAGELYLLATDRPTGQPPPPEGVLGPSGPVRAERPGRVAVGLSGA